MIRQRRLIGPIAAVLLAAELCGCGEDDPAPSDERASEPSPVSAAPATPAAPAAPEAPPAEPKRIFAKRFVVNVRTRPDSEAPRIGYLRGGAVLDATTAEPVGDIGCRRGWYELTTGGFVCNGRDVIAFDGERLPEVRATPADTSAKLPYQYGYSRRNNVAVYRNLPSDEEAAQYEGYRIPGREPAPAAASDGGAAAALDAGTPATEDAGGPPTLESLQARADEEGEETILMRRMLKGFYVSLDRDFRIARRRYWRTQQNEYIPYDMLGLARGSDFAGVELGEGALSPGWITSRRTRAYTRRDDGRVRPGQPPGYHHVFRIASRESIRETPYIVAEDGTLFRERDVREIEVAPRPSEVADDEKWIDVDLARQTLVAYEGDTPVYATLVSTGRIRRENVPDLDHRTPTGSFRISAKHVATTMDGDNAFDGPYSIQDVPYVMYYELAYALHMAFWHDAFGRPKSHGCVNLSPADAKWIFGWTEPSLPEGWHGVYATEESPGTLIRIRGETPRG